MKIIAIHGKAQSGKNTFFNEVSRLYKLNNKNYCLASIREVNFADKLKEIASDLFGFPLSWCYSTEGKNKKLFPDSDFTIREILQKFGTEIARSIYGDIWVWNHEKKLSELEDIGVDLVGITDLRFPNEFEYMKKQNAIMVKIVRPSFKIKENNHKSETALDHLSDSAWDFLCVKDDLNELYRLANVFVNKFLI